MAKQHNHSIGAEDDLDVIEEITTTLNALAEGLDDLAESIGPTDEDYAGKTAAEIAEEDESYDNRHAHRRTQTLRQRTLQAGLSARAAFLPGTKQNARFLRGGKRHHIQYGLWRGR
jgi:uncharacterized membrane protein YccC